MKKLLLIMVLLVTSLVVTLTWFFYQDYQTALSKPLGNIENNAVYNLKMGTSIKKLAADLEHRGIIDRALYLELYVRQNKQSAQIKAGEYVLEKGLTIPTLLTLLKKGSTRQYKFTIIEGTRYTEVISKLASTDHLVRNISPADFVEKFEELSGQSHPEGWLLPDTYFYTRSESEFDLIKRAWNAMQRYLSTAWAGRDKGLPLQSEYEALILASIVEKESGVAKERPLIAGVFINRLNKGMKLQTDPTVIYGMAEKYKGNIRKKDLQTDTPWNTYTRKGLPPTPIATVSKEAIDAVMHPATTTALFFVAKGGGEHQFSDTYKQHRKAVIKYQLKGKSSRYTGDQ